MRRLLFLFCLLPLQALAGATVPPTVPEPGTLELLALGTIVAIVIRIRRRK